MTLTEAAFWTKRLGVIGGVLGVIFIITILVVALSSRTEDTLDLFLTPDFACTETADEFLKSKLSIPSLTLASDSDWDFEISTATGKLDTLLLDVVDVYAFVPVTQSIQAQSEAKKLASKLGFDPESIIRRSTQGYAWQDHTYGITLAVLAKNQNFLFDTDADYIKETSTVGNVPTEQEAITDAKAVLKAAGLENLDEYSTKTTYVSIDSDGKYAKETSASKANLIKVDFVRKRSMLTFRADYVGADSWKETLSSKYGLTLEEGTQVINDEKVSVFTVNTTIALTTSQNSNIAVYVGDEDTTRDTTLIGSIYRIEYVYWPIESESCGKYPLISASVAVNALQTGNKETMGGASLAYLYGHDDDDVAEYEPKSVDVFRIQNVSIVYYETQSDIDELTFLQPVYLISGEAVFKDGKVGTFDFYYPAIDYANVGDKIEVEQPVVEEKSTSFI